LSRGALIAERVVEQPTSKASTETAASIEGTLQLFHADDFDSGWAEFSWRVQEDSGSRTTIRFAIAPDTLTPGMRIRVAGTGDGSAIAPTTISVLAPAAPSQQLAAPTAAAPVPISVLVILVKFSDTATDPFTQASVQTTMTSATTGVAPYWNEASFGNVAMSATVTPWLRTSFATPTWCNASSSHPQSAYDMVETAGNQLAQGAGFNPANYQKIVYLFARVSACGWAGLGEIGGKHAWSNQYNALWVIGHELGHTLGLGHANSLPCNGSVISTTCPVNRPEYGDPFNIMGNQRPMHVSAWQKNYLGWIPDNKVATWTGGTQTYLLSPLETAGGSLYAVQVPAAYHRTYWLEFRKATGFDSGLSSFPTATNGTIVHLNGTMHQWDRSEYDCWDNCFLDMVPTTTTMTDGALAVGKSYTDTYTGITLSAISSGAGGLTVSVAGPPTLKQLALYRPSVRKFLLDFGFDHNPDKRVAFGMAGDVPVVGRVAPGGLSGVGVFRSGMWYFDTTLDGIADRVVAFGTPTDKPLLGDFNNDGQDDLVLYRNGVWYVDQFLNGTVDKTYLFGGMPTDIPQVGDVNGDGIADLVIYRDGTWFIDTNRNGVPDAIVYFGGMPQDRPYLFDWNGDGKADLVVYRDGLWYVNTNLNGTVQAIFGYGTTSDVPFAGRFY
jgi:M6 family metalloprotease-like protein